MRSAIATATAHTAPVIIMPSAFRKSIFILVCCIAIVVYNPLYHFLYVRTLCNFSGCSVSHIL